MSQKKNRNPKCSKEPKYLGKFYAVTMTSVYEAIICGKTNVPRLVKIALIGDSKIAVGGTMCNGTMLAIAKQLILYVPEGSGWISTIQREITLVNTRWWGGGTSNIVALFLKKTMALECTKSKDLKPGDPRWKAETIAVLRAIGEDHPYCGISTGMSDFWLLPPEEWQQKALLPSAA